MDPTAPAGGRGSLDAGYEGAAAYEFTNEPEPVAAADLDLTGRITLAEFLRTVDRRFDELDKTHAGFVSLSNLPKTPAQRAGEGRGRGRGDRPRRERAD